MPCQNTSATTYLPLVLILLVLFSTGTSSSAAPPPIIPPILGSSKVDHSIVLYMDNCPFDHIFGYMDLPGADSAATMTKTKTLWANALDHSQGHSTVTCGTAPYMFTRGGGYNQFSGKPPPMRRLQMSKPIHTCPRATSTRINGGPLGSPWKFYCRTSCPSSRKLRQSLECSKISSPQ